MPKSPRSDGDAAGATVLAIAFERRVVRFPAPYGGRS
jgi:hypothetical protein